jgi:hypothetical protein
MSNDTARTTDGISVGRDANGLYNFAGTYEHRGNLTPEQRDAVFAVVPTLTYAEIPAAIKRVRAGKPAAKPTPKREKVAVWTPEEIRARGNGFIVCPKASR